MSGWGFEFVDAVTSDLAFVARAPTLDRLFATCAEALLAATVEDPASVAARERKRVELREEGLELLLLAWLSELVFERDAHRLLLRPERLHVEGEGPFSLEAELVGERIDPSRHRLETEVKAVTAHELRVVRTGDGWEARVTLDV